MIDVFAYSDYRKLLRDYYDRRKAADPRFSHRYIARKVGFASSGFFAQILRGKSNISAEVALGFIRLLELKKKEADYFELLVLYNQARTAEERRRYLDKLMGFSRSRIKLVAADQYEFYAKWHYAAMRELLACRRCGGDFASLGASLVPPISAEEARQAVDLLLRLGFIRKLASGEYERADSLISTGVEADAEAIHAFQRGTMALAEAAIDRFPRRERDISTLTLSISGEGFRQIHERLVSFHQELLEIARRDAGVDRVYQLNFQFFPLSRAGGSGAEGGGHERKTRVP